ncbi:MAG: hypothetical protein GOVbin2669_36 [Prokaryotic dsDNA virus sp.]|mgnify:CR=1 FL=1|nr:MAG: hypothetical protein GOVbin2669_36 [Prokaryotic dsDNA virus sp.]|tara:strand:+ start:9143 stop:9919 length:777 start_codon:yes stop_codon:yes gene_type:complete
MNLAFNLGNDKFVFKIPENINDLTIEQFIDLQNTIEKTKDEKEVFKILQIVSSLSKIPYKALKTIDEESIGKLIIYVNDLLNTETTIELHNTIRVEGKKYGVNTDFNNMTLGEFVDLETYSKNHTENLHKIMSILYRPYKNKIVAEYKPDKSRSDLFLKKLKVKDIYGVFMKYVEFRNNIYKEFEELFTIKTEELGVNSYNNLGEKWGWYNHIYILANENILNINKVTKLPVYECLTFMSYKQDLNEKIENERRFNKV